MIERRKAGRRQTTGRKRLCLSLSLSLTRLAESQMPPGAFILALCKSSLCSCVISSAPITHRGAQQILQQKENQEGGEWWGVGAPGRRPWWWCTLPEPQRDGSFEGGMAASRNRGGGGCPARLATVVQGVVRSDRSRAACRLGVKKKQGGPGWVRERSGGARTGWGARRPPIGRACRPRG